MDIVLPLELEYDNNENGQAWVSVTDASGEHVCSINRRTGESEEYLEKRARRIAALITASVARDDDGELEQVANDLHFTW